MTTMILFLSIFFHLTCDSIKLPKLEIIEPFLIRQIIFDESGITVPEIDPYHLHLMYQQTVTYNFPVKLFFRLVCKESNFNPNTVSSKEAQGYMQIIPDTWKDICRQLKWPGELKMTPERNIIAGAWYLNYLHEYWTAKIVNNELAWLYTLASYNAGIGNVKNYNGIPPFEETQNYIAYINN